MSENQTAVKDEVNEITDIDGEIKQSAKKKRYLTPKEIIAFCVVSFGQKNLDEFCNANLLYYIVQFFGLSSEAYANISLATSVYDAVDDTLSGLIIDRTRTRWGRVKPYLLLPLPLWMIGTVMLFSSPSMTPTMKIVWVAGSMLLKGLGMSYFSAWNLLLYNNTPNYDERVSMITISEFAKLFGTGFVSLLPILLDVGRNGGVRETTVYHGFAWFSVIFGAATCIFGFRNMRERIPLLSREEMQKVGVLESFRQLIKNRPMFILILGNFFNSFKSVGSSSEKFFWFNCTGKYSYATIAGLFTGLPNYVMTPMASKFIKKYGARNTIIASCLFAASAYTLMFFVGYHPFGETFQSNVVLNLAWMAFALTVCGLPNSVIRVCLPVLSGDVYDYSEWKTGMRNEGLVNTISNYFLKVGYSANTWLAGMVLTWAKYAPMFDSSGTAIPHTDPSVLKGLWIIFSLAPALARGLTGIAFFFFNVHGKFKEQMLSDLEERRSKAILELEQAEKEKGIEEASEAKA